jgi:hypothetical protein
MEQREAHTGAHSTGIPLTHSGGHAAMRGVERIAARARRQPEALFTALMHHCTVDNLLACFVALDGTKAPGVDGVTKATYAQHLEENLQALHQKLHRSRVDRLAGDR